MEYEKKEVGRKIREERKKHKWSQETLGKKINRTGKQISDYERGELIPPNDTLNQLCMLFECERGYLLGEPDYSEKTRLLTKIMEETGLNEAGLEAIRRATGVSKKNAPILSRFDPQNAKRTFNSFISAKRFNNFLDALYALNDEIEEEKNIFNEYEKEIGSERFAYAAEMSSYEGEPVNKEDGSWEFVWDPSIPKPTPQQFDDIKGFIDREGRQYDMEFKIKVLRYELYEAFVNLIDELYPK